MAVRKYVRFAAPHRSKTYNDKDHFLVGKNGVISGGEVTQSGMLVTIQPLVLIQNGQVVDINVALSATAPSSIQPPYFIAVSISSPIENIGEVITPVFVNRPQDINSQVTLIAEYDGSEWISLPKLQVSEQITADQERSVIAGLTGVASGFEVTFGGSNVTVSPGSLIDVNGRLVTKSLTTTLPVVPVSSMGYSRVDSVVYRKPQDSVNRAGSLKYVTGPSFSTSTLPAPPVTSAGTAAAYGAKSVHNKSTGVLAHVRNESGNLVATIQDAAFSPLYTGTVATGAGDFDFCLNPNGAYEVVYTNAAGTDLYYLRFNSLGAILQGPSVVSSTPLTFYQPQVVTVKAGTTFFTHVIFAKYVSATERVFKYARISESNTLDTPETLLIDLNSMLANPSLEKCDNDSLIYMAFDNLDTQKTYLYVYDASTATASTPPNQVESPVELQNDVYNKATLTAMSPTGSSRPLVLKTDNQEVFVIWRHFVSLGNYGIAIYNKRYKSTHGYKAFIVTSLNADFYSADVDGLNNLYIAACTNSAADVTVESIDLEKLSSLMSVPYYATGSVTAPSIKFTSRGELFVNFSETFLGDIYSLVGPASSEVTQRITPVVAASDIPLANFKRPADTLSVSGLLVEEDVAVRRIYELMSLCAATGSVSWNSVGPNVLSIIAAIKLRFFNRDGELTIPANVPGVTIPTGCAAVVEVPDEDITTNLTVEVVPFGDGVLDRNGRRKVVLFWNISGVLYTRFAPFRMSGDGETIIIGDSMSQEMLSWLGASDSTPDASNHGYSSTTYILQSDSHNVAIGKLDASLGAYANSGTAGIIPLSAGVDTITVVFGAPRATATYRPTATFENLVDAAPMIMPVMITGKSTGGFTLSWPAPLDTGNYSLDYILRDTV